MVASRASTTRRPCRPTSRSSWPSPPTSPNRSSPSWRPVDDVDSVGINGQIVVAEDGTTAGLWVAGVASGSIADDVGIEPGDLVTRIEGVTIGLDGTMKDYCDVLRSHAPDDELAIEVLRYATSEVLEGELNGDVLTQSFSFADQYADDDATPTGDSYEEYVAIDRRHRHDLGLGADGVERRRRCGHRSR